MMRVRLFVAVCCSLLMLLPSAGAQPPAPAPAPASPVGTTIDAGGSRFIRPYRAPDIGPINLANTNRLDALLRAGKLYLSIQDVIALALENNLDIELQRYGPRIARADFKRASAGSALRGVSTGISTASSPGATMNGMNVNAFTSAGPATLNLDPVVVTSYNRNHQTTPQTSSFVTGTNSLVTTTGATNVSLQKSYLTGTTTSLGWDTTQSLSNSYRNDFNPARSGGISLNVQQHLLQGFGVALNNRFIRIAKNNLRLSDLTFQQQVIITVAAVESLYWDLVSFNENVKVSQQALALAEKLYNDNKKQVEIGTLAPIEIVRAEAEVAARQQDLTVAETQLLFQETIIKNALSRTGVASPSVSEARIIPTDRMNVPEKDAMPPMQELVTKAVESRPDVAQTRIVMANAQISLRGSKNVLLPSLDFTGSLRNNGLAGDVNQVPTPGLTYDQRVAAVNPYFLGGMGRMMEQIMRHNFPNYSFGFQLNIPLRNRTAQADVVRDQLVVRQAQIQEQQQINQVRVDVVNGMVGVQQARARYQSAVKGRVLQEQTLDAEQKKYALGASTVFLVIQAQRDLATARYTEVAAQAAYSKARVQLDLATGQTLPASNIVIDEAQKGRVSTPPSALPAGSSN